MDDADVCVMYAPANGGFIARDKVRVKLSHCYDRKSLPEPNESKICTLWQSRLSTNKKLWNGTKFRLASIKEDAGTVIFNIGITCYRDFIGTNWSPEASLFQRLGGDNWNDRQAYMSDALGVGSLIETADSKAIFLRRSQICGEAVGLYDIPGGHPEPQVGLKVV